MDSVRARGFLLGLACGDALGRPVESVRQRDGDIDALGNRDEFGNHEWWPDRKERLRILAELLPDETEYVVVDDLDLSHVDR